ncbi:MAG: O-antigen ligase family protein [Bacteroidales bacterium]|nr:O-antigen ligase family protein [Bacteroidales bacterium]
MKRGAILIGVFALIYFLYINRKVVQKKYKVLTNFLTIGIFFVGAFVVNSYLISNEYFVSRIDATMEGDSSNRDQLYTYFLSHFMEEQNPINFLFGHGANGTLSIYIDYAHNDWLELAINQGLLGLLVYAIYWVMFIKSIRQFRENALMKNYLTIFFIIFFVKSFFSMSYQMNIYASAILGYMIGAHGISKGQYLKLS